MNLEDHPILRDTSTAMQQAIVYSDDPLAAVLATRLIILEARLMSEQTLRRAYGREWESLLGILRLTETLTAEEEEVLSDRLSLRHRRLLAIGVKWLEELGRREIVRDVFEDIDRIRPGAAERTMTAMRLAVVTGMLHNDSGRDTPISTRDEIEMSQPIRAVLMGRGVQL